MRFSVSVCTVAALLAAECAMAGFRVKDGNPVADKAPESIAKPREESPSAVRTTFRKKGEIPVYTNSLWRPPATAGEKMAHEKA